MKKKTLLLLCLVLVLVIAGAGVLYNSLADQFRIGGLAAVPQETQRPTQATEQPTVEAAEPPETEAPTQAATEPSAEVTEPPTEAITEPQDTEPPVYIAPDFTMQDMDGNEVTLASFFGKPIVLNFWASWCGPCKMEMPEIQKFYEQYGNEVHFLLVSVDDSVDSAKAFLAGTDYTFPVYFDTTSVGAYTYGASSIPLTYFIDAEGNLTAYYMGAMSESILQQGVDMIYTPAATE